MRVRHGWGSSPAGSGACHTGPPGRAGAEEAAERQGIATDHLIRTIVLRRGEDDYLFALVPGGSNIAWPVVADASIPGMGTVAMGSGRRGTSIQLDADAMLDALDADVADLT